MAANGVYIVQGELNSLVAQLRRSTTGNQKWQSALSADQDVLLRSFVDLREVLTSVPDLSDMAPSTFLAPFLEVVRSEHTNGQVTGQALAAVGKFISYGLINPQNFTAPGAVQSIADSVNRTRFVGNDAGSDEVVLFRILQVLRTLLLTPVGSLLSDESVCELLQSCFRICFEKRLTELLRKSAECCLIDMVQLLFTRLPTFVEDPRHPYVRRLKMRGERRSKVDRKDAEGMEGQSKPASAEPSLEGQIGNEKSDRLENENRPNEDSFPNAAVSLVERDFAPDSDDAILKDKLIDQVAKIDPIQADRPIADDSSGPAAILPPPLDGEGAKYHEIISESGLEIASPINSDNEEEYDRSRDVRFTVTVDGAKPTDTDGNSTVNDGFSTATDGISIVTDGMSTVNDGVSAVTGGSLTVTDGSLTVTDGSSTVIGGPYGLPSVRELLRFLISVSNPDEKHNSDEMLELGLNLLIIALEAGADHLGKFSILLPLIRNDLCKILNSNLLSSKSSIFASTLRVGFLCFEALRTHLKFQLESYLTRLKELVLSDQILSPGAGSGSFVMQARLTGSSVQNSTLFERKELALEALVELWRIPGLVTELYLNYDCDLYCSNLFEELTKLLSKNSFPIGQELTSAHLLSLDALLTVVDSIEINCHYRMLNYSNELKQKNAQTESDPNVTSSNYMLPVASGISAGRLLESRGINPTLEICQKSPNDEKSNEALIETLHLPQLRPNRMPIKYEQIFSHEDLIARKQKKRLLQTGTDLFNQSPAKGVAFLQEHGIFRSPLQALDLVEWLKENPHLDKRKIAEYIVNRKQAEILEVFVKSFEFRGVRIDQALRQFLEAFRLPGEAAEISMVLEHFSEHWHCANGCPFASSDAAFTLAYAVIMLNVDHHNPTAKKQNPPMSAAAFKKNVNGVNGGQNFDQSMLDEVYKGVSSNEIIMPAEQTGSVRENYLWKLLLRRGAKQEGRFVHAPSGLYDHDLFQLVWGPTVAALSYVFDKTQEEQISARAASGFRKCSAVAAHYVMSDVFDNLVINLCKFSQILAFPENPAQLVSNLAENHKSQCAAKTMFQLVRNHGDILREGWKNVCECLLQLFKADLLPENLTRVEDFVHPDGQISIAYENFRSKKSRDAYASSASIFSSFYNYLGGSSADDNASGTLSLSSKDGAAVAREMVTVDCRPDQLIVESKYLTSEALADLLKALVVGGAQATHTWTAATLPSTASVRQRAESREKDDDAELSAVFYLELLVSVCLENRDRLTPYWRTLRSHIFTLIAAGEQRRRRYGDTPAAEDEDDDGNESSILTSSTNGSVVRRLALERSVVALLRLVSRLLARASHSGDEFSMTSRDTLTLRGDDFSTTLVGDLVASLSSLRRSLRRSTVVALSRQIAGGAARIVRAGGQALRAAPSAGWAPIVDLLEAAGAGVFDDEEVEAPNDEGARVTKRRDEVTKRGVSIKKAVTAKSDNETSRHVNDGEEGEASLDRGYTSDTEPYATSSTDGAAVCAAPSGVARGDDSSLASSGEWLYVVGGGGGLAKTTRGVVTATPPRQRTRPRVYDSAAFAQCCDTLSFWIRDAADLVTSQNFDLCVSCLRTFVHASVDIGTQRYSTPSTIVGGKKSRDKNSAVSAEREKTSAAALESLEEAALQLIDLTFALHVKSSVVYCGKADDAQGVQIIWRQCWLPVLQILAHACSDSRRRVRLSALTYLQRTLLMQELRLLSAIQWQECCYHVLFPLLAALLNEKETHFYGGRKSPKKNSRPDPNDPTAPTHQRNTGLDEARVRATTLTSKVFLQHLGPLSAHPRRHEFVQLWVDLLDFMSRYLALDNSDLNESVPESVKNMLLVLRTANLFKRDDLLYERTREKLSHFLPDLVAMVDVVEGGCVAENDAGIVGEKACDKNEYIVVDIE